MMIWFKKIGEEGASMANRIFLYNLVVLSISNAAEFGRMYSGGYKTARKAFNKKINVNEKRFIWIYKTL